MTSQVIALRAGDGNALGWRACLATDRSLAPLALRITLAAVMLPHGVQKALGWLGGHGWSGTMNFLTETMGLPMLIATGVILLELVGPLLLLVGLGTRAVAAGFVGLMIGAVATVHGSHGFFMNWSGGQAGEGFEYHLLLIGLALGLVLHGGGRASLDNRLTQRGSTS